MADDVFVQKFGFDVVGASDLENKLIKALKNYNQVAENINKVQAQFNKEGKANRVVVSGMSDDMKAFTIELKASGSVWKNVDTEVKKTVKTLTVAEQKFKDIRDSEIIGLKKRTAEQIKHEKEVRASFARIANDERRALAQRKRQQIEFARATQVARNAPATRFNNGLGAFAASPEDRIRAIRQQELIALHQRKVQAELDKTTAAFHRAGRAGKESAKEVLISWQSVQRLFLIQVMHQALSELKIRLEQASIDALEFGKRVAEIQTLSQDANQSTQQWSTSLINLSNAYGLDLLKTAEAAYESLSNQIINTTRDFDFLRQAALLSVSTNSSVEVSVDALSSVLNSFNLAQSESSRIAAILFKTVDLGKTRLDELAQNLGRVNALSKILGVSFEEQSAALATLTIQGVKDHTAKTFLINIYQKLNRPSEHLVQIFEQWGVSSAQAAIQTYGFGEVLARLSTIANGTGDAAKEIGEIFQEMRAQAGFATLDLKRYESTLNEINNAQTNYTKATEIALGSTAKQIEIQMTRVRNQFTQYGATLNETFLKFTLLFGDADKIVRFFVHRIEALVVAFTAFKTVSYLTALSMVSFRRATLLVGIAMGQFTKSATAARFAMLTLKSAMAGFIPLAIAGLAELALYQLRWKERIEESGEAFRRQFDDFGVAVIDEFNDRLQIMSQEFDKNMSQIEKRLAQLNTFFSLEFRKMAVDMNAQTGRFKDAIDKLFFGSTKAFTERISQLKKELRDLASSSADLKSEAADLVVDKQKTKFDFDIDAAKRTGDPLKELAVYNVEIGRLKNLLVNVRNEGQRLEILEQLREVFTAQRDFAKDIGDLQTIWSAERGILKTYDEQNAAITEQVRLNDERAAKAKKELEDQKKRQKEFKTNFSAFRGLNEKTTPQQFEDIANRLRKAADAANLSVQEQLQLEELIATQRAFYGRNAQEKAKQERLASLRAEAAAALKIFKDAKTELDKIKTDTINQLTGSSSENGEALGKLLEGASNIFTDDYRVADRVSALRAQIQLAIDNQTKLTKEGVNLPEAERNKLLQEQKTLIFTINQEYKKLYGDTVLVTNAQGQVTESANTLFQGILNNLIETERKFGTLNKQVAFVGDMADAFKQMNAELKKMEGINLQNWNTQVEGIKNVHDEVIERMKVIIKGYEELRKGLPLPTNFPATPGFTGFSANGGPVKYMARGGDSVPTMLQRGEYVWDRMTTRQNMPFIRAMHDMSRFNNRGGGSSNQSFTFGDININGGSEQVGNDLVRVIKRAIRTGQLKV